MKLKKPKPQSLDLWLPVVTNFCLSKIHSGIFLMDFVDPNFKGLEYCHLPASNQFHTRLQHCVNPMICQGQGGKKKERKKEALQALSKPCFRDKKNPT